MIGGCQGRAVPAKIGSSARRIGAVVDGGCRRVFCVCVCVCVGGGNYVILCINGRSDRPLTFSDRPLTFGMCPTTHVFVSFCHLHPHLGIYAILYHKDNTCLHAVIDLNK